MNNKFNYDKLFIFICLVSLPFQIFFIPSKTLYFSLIITFSIISYLLLVYHKRNIYGVTGLAIISIPSLAFFTYTVFIGIPSIFIAHEYVLNVDVYIYSIASFYFIYPAGLMMGYLIKPIKNADINKLYNAKFYVSYIEPYVFVFFKILLVVCISGVFLYLFRVDKIPLIEMLKNPGDLSAAWTLREEALKTLDITFIERYFFHWLRSLIFPIIISLGGFFMITRNTLKYKMLFIALFITGVLYNSLTLEKSPAAAIFLAMMAFYFLYKNKISLKFILISTFLIFFIPVLIFVLIHFGRPDIVKVIWITLLRRIFLIPAEALYQYFRIFPEIHPFLLGRSTNITSWLFAEGTFPINNYVAAVWWGVIKTTGSANALYLGYYWADYGILGVIISTFIVGFTIHLVYWKLVDSTEYKKDLNFVAITCYLTPIFTFVFFSSNYTTIFFTRGLFLIIVYLNLISNKKVIKWLEENIKIS